MAQSLRLDRFEKHGYFKCAPHDSLYVPLAKWPMLLTGNYRCVGQDGVIPIANAVHDDLSLSDAICDWVANLCVALGAHRDDLVPFQKHAAAAASLKKPSPAARSLATGAEDIERVDVLVQRVAMQKGMPHPQIDRVVRRVDIALRRNRESRLQLAA